jgi:hypothetical protein
METITPNTAVVCVLSTSVTISQSLLPISAEPSLSTLSTIFPSDTSPQKLFPPHLKISPIPKISRKYSNENKLILSRKSEQEKRNKLRSREIESVNIPKTTGLQAQKMHKEMSIKQMFIINRHENSEKFCECWENYVQTTKENDRIECVFCSNWLHEFFFDTKKSASAVVERHSTGLENLVRSNLDL